MMRSIAVAAYSTPMLHLMRGEFLRIYKSATIGVDDLVKALLSVVFLVEIASPLDKNR